MRAGGLPGETPEGAARPNRLAYVLLPHCGSTNRQATVVEAAAAGARTVLAATQAARTNQRGDGAGD